MINSNELKMRRCDACQMWTEISALQECNDCEKRFCNDCFIEKTDRCVNCDEVYLETHKEAY